MAKKTPTTDPTPVQKEAISEPKKKRGRPRTALVPTDLSKKTGKADSSPKNLSKATQNARKTNKTDKTKKENTNKLLVPNNPEVLPTDKTKAKKKRGEPHVTRPTACEEVTIAERRELVLDLKKKGASIRQIAKLLDARGFEHCSPSTVAADLQAELENRANVRLKKTDLLVQEELEKIESWEFAISPLLDKHLGIYDTDAKVSIINTCIRLQNQRDKYLNISKSQQSENKWKDSMARFLEIDPEELPDDEDGDDDQD